MGRIFFALENLSFKIVTKTADLPSNWDEVAAQNHFLQTPYLQVLEQSAPTNMHCFYIAIFKNSTLIGVALAQYLNVHQLDSFGERDKCLKTALRNFIFKNFASHVLFLGNNMITGQNSYAFSIPIDLASVSEILVQSAQALVTYFKEKKVNIHLVSFKDFYEHCSVELKKHHFSSLYEFNTQPNMIFNLPASWKTESDYVAAFSKKYRDQFKRAHKKIEGIEVRELDVNEVIYYEEAIYKLYHYVAQNAPFNTFFLAKNHFSTFKKQCGSRFRICGYFFEGR